MMLRGKTSQDPDRYPTGSLLGRLAVGLWIENYTRTGNKQPVMTKPRKPPKQIPQGKAKVKEKLADSDKLWLFINRAAELQSKRYFKEFKVLEETHPQEVTGLAGTVAKLIGTSVDEEFFISFLVAYRLFHQPSEPTYIGTIQNILTGALKGEPKALERIRQIEQEFEKGDQFLAKIYDLQGGHIKDLTEKDIFHLWLDTRYFHSDCDGLQFFYQMDENRIEESRHLFELMLQKYVRRVENYLSLAVDVLERRLLPTGFGSFTFEVVRPDEQLAENNRGRRITVSRYSLDEK